ncbi:PHD finger and BAH domain protein [Morchella snyderi]|nr:PHD finger and BAH domain protein [Morchella snyderi]
MADRKSSTTSRAPAGNGASTEAPNSTSATQTPSASNIRSTSPYGTRSRNRGSRVNYAEDKDNDMDYEYTTTSASSSKSPAGAVAEIVVPTTTSSRRASAVGGSASKDKEGAKEITAVVATTTATSSKKRKKEYIAPVMPKDMGLSNMLSFDSPKLKNGQLIADDGTTLSVNDHIYLVCEPPGEPYYLARIMEFLHTNNDPTQPIDSIRVNWYYRPKDIQRKVTDTRVLFSSMHSDSCPLAAIRGKCYILHRSEVEDVDEFRKGRDSFYFEKMFDRYIHRYYDVIPTNQVRNVPEKVRKVLVDRWKYLLVEPQRAKELCSQMKECKRCAGFCASNDSVHCAVCGNTYHMNCVRPPLLKKPSRGFAWACGPCNRAQERKLEQRNTPTLTNSANGDADEENFDDEDEDMSPGGGGCSSGGIETETASESADIERVPTAEQAHWAQMWPMRYLGQHCRVEDALDPDDRIFPRAASRIGPRHQANVNVWHGRPVEYVKPVEIKKKYVKGGSKNAKSAAAAAEAEAAAKEKRPKWVMDEPLGYIRRGEDDGTTSTLLFKIPEDETKEEKLQIVDEYMKTTRDISRSLPGSTIAGPGCDGSSVNFQDKAIELLYANDFDTDTSLDLLKKVHVNKELREPKLKPDELKRFEEGVARYGSELHSVAKCVKTRKEAEIVRFYYVWKKTEKGKQIWGNFEGRKGKKEAKMKDKDTGTKLVDDVADDEDDSAFDGNKAIVQKRGFECKFCSTRSSRQWRRAPGVPPGTLIPADKGGSSKKKQGEEKFLISALCRRCAELWRRYGIQWEDPDEIQKKVSAGGGRAWKRRIDEELLKELNAAQEDAKAEAAAIAARTASPQPVAFGVAPIPETPEEKKEPPRKKLKVETNGTNKKGKEKEKVEKPKEPPPPPPEPPKPKLLPCAVCGDLEPLGNAHLVCRDCRMTVHRGCYGVGEVRSANKWVCEMCANDKNPTVSTNYECVLCPCHGIPEPEEVTDQKKEEPQPKTSDKKKGKTVNEKEKEKEKEKQVVITSNHHEDGRKTKEADKRRPQHPREPLKKTSGNNWAHVICAVWTPEVKFSDAKSMKTVEGVGTIPAAKWTQTCRVCKGKDNGACVGCQVCYASVHVGCAHKAGWHMGFDIQPVKSSRRDMKEVVKLGSETGAMTAAVWCPEHDVKSTIHPIGEFVEETGQADLGLTGTVRKANLMTISTKASQSHRRNSAGGSSAAGISGKEITCSPTTVYIKTEGLEDKIGGIEGLLNDHVGGDGPKRCFNCQTDISPLWWKMPVLRPKENGIAHLTNGSASPATNGVLINGDATAHDNTHPVAHTRSHAVGLLCNRCHCKEVSRPESERQSPFVGMNGQQEQSRYTPLPPLHVFLAAQQPAPPPPPPPQPIPPVSAIPSPIHPVHMQSGMPSQIGQPQMAQMPPIPQQIPHPGPQSHSLPHHSIPHQSPHPHPHMSPLQPPPHISPHLAQSHISVLQHHAAPPPPPSHVSPHIQHMSPHQPHVSPRQPQHVSPHQPHVTPHQAHQPLQPQHVPHVPNHQSSLMSPRNLPQQMPLQHMVTHAPHVSAHMGRTNAVTVTMQPVPMMQQQHQQQQQQQQQQQHIHRTNSSISISSTNSSKGYRR